MNKRKFTIKHIKQFLKEHLNIEWIDYLVYSTSDSKYRKANLKDFSKPCVQMYLKSQAQNHPSIILADITTSSFVLISGRSKINASASWVDFLHEHEKEGMVEAN